MLYEMTGTIKLINDIMSFPSGFTKRQFVITSEEDRYPQDIPMAFTKDRCALLDGVKPGERVKVTFSLRGREWQGKYFLDAEAIKIESLDAAAGDSGGGMVAEVDIPPSAGEIDDMPF